jgi:hypothetical protein
LFKLDWPQKEANARKLNLNNIIDLFYFDCSVKEFLHPVCPDARLHMIIQRFCLLKFTKPADEHHLQAVADALANLATVKHDSFSDIKNNCSQLGRLN